jgi:hypothetical protein
MDLFRRLVQCCWPNKPDDEDHAVQWMPDHCTNVCLHCDAPFTVVRRRHHCRDCGGIYCKDCLVDDPVKVWLCKYGCPSGQHANDDEISDDAYLCRELIVYNPAASLHNLVNGSLDAFEKDGSTGAANLTGALIVYNPLTLQDLVNGSAAALEKDVSTGVTNLFDALSVFSPLSSIEHLLYASVDTIEKTTEFSILSGALIVYNPLSSNQDLVNGSAAAFEKDVSTGVSNLINAIPIEKCGTTTETIPTLNSKVPTGYYAASSAEDFVFVKACDAQIPEHMAVVTKVGDVRTPPHNQFVPLATNAAIMCSSYAGFQIIGVNSHISFPKSSNTSSNGSDDDQDVFQTGFSALKRESWTQCFDKESEKIALEYLSSKDRRAEIDKSMAVSSMPSSLFGMDDRISLKKLVIKRDIKSGAFGKVREVQYKGECYALKEQSLEGISEHNLRLLCNELKILIDLRNEEYCVQLYSAWIENKNLYLLLELAETDLQDEIKNSMIVVESQAAQIVFDVLQGLRRLELRQIIHRDIKPANILKIKCGSGFKHKLSDFGLATYYADYDRGRCGTPAYMDPRVLKNMNYDCSVDIWSLGVVLYEMVEKQRPFAGSKFSQVRVSVDAVVKSGGLDYATMSEDCADMVNRMLIFDRSLVHIPISELLQHEFLLSAF